MGAQEDKRQRRVGHNVPATGASVKVSLVIDTNSRSTNHDYRVPPLILFLLSKDLLLTNTNSIRVEYLGCFYSVPLAGECAIRSRETQESCSYTAFCRSVI